MRFRVPATVTKVFIHEKNQPQQQVPTGTQHWQDINSLGSIASYAGSYVDSVSNMSRQAQPEDNDICDYNLSKRTVVWSVKNFRGQQNRNLDISLTYKKGTVINETLFKQLSPFNCDFDIPNHTVSGIKINKMEVRVEQQPAGDPNHGVEPGKWLRHKTFSGSYAFRI